MMNWNTVKTVFWSAIGGALVWWIVLSAGFGWMPAGTAEQKAGVRAKTAVLDVLTPICVERFNQDANRVQKLAALKKENSWQHDDFVIKQGWATIPGDGHADPGVAQACANQILAANGS
jgi:hypothetical protein